MATLMFVAAAGAPGASADPLATAGAAEGTLSFTTNIALCMSGGDSGPGIATATQIAEDIVAITAVGSAASFHGVGTGGGGGVGVITFNCPTFAGTANMVGLSFTSCPGGGFTASASGPTVSASFTTDVGACAGPDAGTCDAGGETGITVNGGSCMAVTCHDGSNIGVALLSNCFAPHTCQDGSVIGIHVSEGCSGIICTDPPGVYSDNTCNPQTCSGTPPGIVIQGTCTPDNCDDNTGVQIGETCLDPEICGGDGETGVANHGGPCTVILCEDTGVQAGDECQHAGPCPGPGIIVPGLGCIGLGGVCNPGQPCVSLEPGSLISPLAGQLPDVAPRPTPTAKIGTIQVCSSVWGCDTLVWVALGGDDLCDFWTNEVPTVTTCTGNFPLDPPENLYANFDQIAVACIKNAQIKIDLNGDGTPEDTKPGVTVTPAPC